MMESIVTHIAFTHNKIESHSVIDMVSNPECGAVATFIGVTRRTSHDKTVVKLVYEAYEIMAAKLIRGKCNEMRAAYPGVTNIAIVHKLGDCFVGDFGIVISISAKHRLEALCACHELIDSIKSFAPIWKREFYEDGSSWVENKEWKPFLNSLQASG